MNNNYGKIGLLAGALSFVLLVVGVRNVLGYEMEVLNFVAFAVFSLIIGINVTTLLFYNLKVAFPIFIVAVAIAFFEMFRSYITDFNGMGDTIGMLSLFVISSFGLAFALIVQFLSRFMPKKEGPGQ